MLSLFPPIRHSVTDYLPAWLGTTTSISLSGWTLASTDGTPGGITADKIYTGAMGDGGESMQLKDSGNNVIDSANQAGAWYAGSTTGRSTMSRVDVNVSGTEWGEAPAKAGASPEAERVIRTVPTVQSMFGKAPRIEPA